jgi:hypothetical protein
MGCPFVCFMGLKTLILIINLKYFIMTVEESLKEQLTSRGLAHHQAKEIVHIIKERSHKNFNGYVFNWTVEVDQYPLGLVPDLFIFSRPIIFCWINEFKPNAWYKSLFEPVNNVIVKTYKDGGKWYDHLKTTTTIAVHDWRSILEEVYLANPHFKDYHLYLYITSPGRELICDRLVLKVKKDDGQE